MVKMPLTSLCVLGRTLHFTEGTSSVLFLLLLCAFPLISNEDTAVLGPDRESFERRRAWQPAQGIRHPRWRQATLDVWWLRFGSLRMVPYLV